MGSLAVVAGQDAANGQILVQIGPVEEEGGELDVVELLGEFAFRARIPFDREGDLQPALHLDLDLACPVSGAHRAVNQGAHAAQSVTGVPGRLPRSRYGIVAVHAVVSPLSNPSANTSSSAS